MKFRFNWVIFRFHVSFPGVYEPPLSHDPYFCVFFSGIHRCIFHLLHRMDNVHCSSAFLPSNDLVEHKKILR